MSAADSAEPAETLRLLSEALKGLRYGQVLVQVHDGKVVQIERTEKVRPHAPPITRARR